MSFFAQWLKGLMAPSYSGEWINGVTGAGGAILGSIVTITWTAWYNRLTRLRERREKFAAGAFAAYQRLNQIYSASLTIRDHLDYGRAMAVAKQQPICTTTMGVLVLPGPVNFPIEELWTLTQVGGKELINEVNSLDQSFNQLLNAIERYDVNRNKVWSKFPSPNKMDGVVGQVDLTEEQNRALAPDIAMLDSMLEQITPISHSIVKDSFKALTILIHAKTQPLGKTFVVKTRSPTGEIVEIKSNQK